MLDRYATVLYSSYTNKKYKKRKIKHNNSTLIEINISSDMDDDSKDLLKRLIQEKCNEESPVLSAGTHRVGSQYITTDRTIVRYLKPSSALDELRYQVLELKPLASGGYGKVFESYMRIIINNDKLEIKPCREDRVVKISRTNKYHNDDDLVHSVKNEYKYNKIILGTSGNKKPVFFSKSNRVNSALILRRQPGISLSQLTETSLFKSKFTFADRLHLTLLIAQKLKDIHSLGYIHSDIKPENIMVEASGGVLSVNIIDFGLTRKEKVFEKIFSNAGCLGRTARYAAPEIISNSGSPSKKVDVYSLGVVMQQLFSSSNEQFRNSCIFYKSMQKKALKPYIPSIACGKFEDDYKKIVKNILEPDQNKRLSSVDVVNNLANFESIVLKDDLNSLKNKLIDISSDLGNYKSTWSAHQDIKCALGIEINNFKSKIDTLIKSKQVSRNDYDRVVNGVSNLFSAKSEISISGKKYKVNTLFNNENPLKKVVNAITQPLAWLISSFIDNRLIAEQGFFHTRGSEVVYDLRNDLENFYSHSLNGVSGI